MIPKITGYQLIFRSMFFQFRPGTEIAVMGAQGAVNILYRDEVSILLLKFYLVYNIIHLHIVAKI